MTALAAWLVAMTAITGLALAADRRWADRLRPTVLAGAWFVLVLAWLVPFRPALLGQGTDGAGSSGASAAQGAADGAVIRTLTGIGWVRPEAAAGADPGAGGLRWLVAALLAVWAVGALVEIARAGIAHRRLRAHVDRWGTEVDADLVRALLGGSAGDDRRLPRVVVAPVGASLVVGVRSPRVVVPVLDTDADLVLRHERAHLRRHDPAQRVVLALVRAVHWWNPVVRRAVAAAVRSSEVACDAAATHDLGPSGRVRYARALLSALPGAPVPGRVLVPALTEGTDVARRITTLFVEGRRHRGVALLTLGAALVLGIGIPVAADAADGGSATPEGCVPGTVVSEDGAQACELVDDPAVAAPEGWASANEVSADPGSAPGSQAAAEQAEAAAAAEHAMGASDTTATTDETLVLAESTDGGGDEVLIDRLSAYAKDGITVDPDGTVRYHGELVQALVLERDEDVTSLVWDDRGTVRLSVEGDSLRVMSDEEAQRLFG